MPEARYFVSGDCVLTGDGTPTSIFEGYVTLQDAKDRVESLREGDSYCKLEIIHERGVVQVKRQTLSNKIFRISREAGAVERKGVAENNGNESRPLYAYPRIEDVLDVVHPLLNKYKLIATGSVVKEPVTHVIRGGAATTEILVEWTLEDSETGES